MASQSSSPSPNQPIENVNYVEKVALIVGVTSLVGQQLHLRLLQNPEWKLVYGLARNLPKTNIAGLEHPAKFCFLPCDLLNCNEVAAKLSPLAGQVTHIFWMPRPNFPSIVQSPESNHRSRLMLSNVLDVLFAFPALALRHLALQTGTSHYVSLSTIDIPNAVVDCDEDKPRPADGLAFDYYAMEDVLNQRLSSVSSISWSVHRPGLLLGMSDHAPLNIVGALCVYGTICKFLGMPFLYMGSKRCWEEPYIELSDVRLVVDQLVWWVSRGSVGACGFEAFNVVNDIGFTWKRVWGVVGEKFGLSVPEEAVAEEMSYGEVMGGKGEVWGEIVGRNGLRASKMEELANWEFVDSLFRCPFRMVASSAKARGMGFMGQYSGSECLLYWVDRMREERLVP